MRGAHLLKTRYLNFFEHRGRAHFKHFSGRYSRIFFWDKYKAMTIKCFSVEAVPGLFNVKLVVHTVTTRLSNGSMDINFRRFFLPCSSSELQICTKLYGVTFCRTVSLVLATVITSYLVFCCYLPRHFFLQQSPNFQDVGGATTSVIN